MTSPTADSISVGADAQGTTDLLRSWETRAAQVEKNNDAINRDQWKLIRDHVHTNVREIANITRDLQALKDWQAKYVPDVLAREQALASRVDESIGTLKEDLETEKTQRASRTSQLDRDLIAVNDRLDAQGVSDATFRQKIELAMGTMKKESKERNDTTCEKIAALESSLGSQILTAVNDMKAANLKLQASMKEQFDGLLEMQELAKKAASDAVALETRGREDAIHELQGQVLRRMSEEKAAREAQCNLLRDSLSSNLAEAKETVDARVRGISQVVDAESAKREKQLSAMQDSLAAALAAEKEARELGHADVHATLGREKQGRDTQLAAINGVLETERAAREAHAKDLHELVHAHKDSHNQKLGDELGRERSLREAAGAELSKLVHDRLREHHGSAKDFENSATSRIAQLEQTINREKAAREAMVQELFSKCRAETDAVLLKKIKAEAEEREACFQALRRMLESETSSRESDLDEVRDLIGLHRKLHDDHRNEFETLLEKARTDVHEHHRGLHEKVDKERAEREALHAAHADRLQALVDKEGNSRAEHHSKILDQLDELRASIAGESEAADAKLQKLQEQISALETVIGDGDSSEMKAAAAKNSTASNRNVLGVVAPRNRDVRCMVPIEDRLKALEGRLLETWEAESRARQEHHGKVSDLLDAESKKHESMLTEHMRQLHSRHADLHSLLEKERKERAAHLDSHGRERDDLHKGLHDRLSKLQDNHDKHAEHLEAFQERVNQAVEEELGRLENVIREEKECREELCQSIRDDIDVQVRDVQEGLAREAGLRESSCADLGELLSRRIDYLQTIISFDEEGSDIRSESNFAYGSEAVFSTSRRVVTLQSRLDVAERRLRGELAREIEAREGDRRKFQELLDAETQSRDDMYRSVKASFDKERTTRESRLGEESTKLDRDIAALKETTGKLSHEAEQREKALLTTIDRDVTAVKRDLEEYRSQLTAADKAIERSMVTLGERLSAEEANNETHRQRFDLALAGQKKDTKEKHDLALERIAFVDNRFEEALPAAVSEMKDTNSRLQHSVKDQVDALKMLQDTHKTAFNDLVSLEKSTREEAMKDLQTHIANRFNEERSHRDSREGFLQNTLASRMAEEKEDREASLLSVMQSLSSERTKRETSLAALQEAYTAGIAEVRHDVDARHSELKGALEREKEVNESHRAAVQGLHEEGNTAREAHVRDVKQQLESHRNAHQAHLESESTIRNAHAKEFRSLVANHTQALKDGLNEESKLREEHVAKLHKALADERQARDATLSRERADRDALLQDKSEALRADFEKAVKRIDAVTNDAQELLGKKARRLDYIEKVLGESYLQDADFKSLVTIKQQLEALEVKTNDKLREEVVREAQARQKDMFVQQQAVGQEATARSALEAATKELIAKERCDRDKKIHETMEVFRQNIIQKLLAA